VIEIGLAGAFLGGLFALVSPCSALLLPSFFAYAFGGVGKLVARTGLFYVGLALVLIPLGAGVGALGTLVTQYRGAVTTAGGVLLIAFGLAAILGLGFSILPSASTARASSGKGWPSVIFLGAVYGLAGFCSGPLLGAVLTFAMTGGSPAYGGLLMAFYGLGMAVPLFVLALLWDRLELGKKQWLRGRELRLGPLRTHSTSLISGLVFIAIGVLFITTEGTANLGGIMGVEAQFQLQAWASNVAEHIPDFVLPLMVFLLLVPVLLRFLRGARRREVSQE